MFCHIRSALSRKNEDPPCFRPASASCSVSLSMDWRTSCVAVIPCLNEEATIGPLVAGVRRHVSHVLVIDDGSSDQTGLAARQAGAEVLRHETSRGKGAALRTGWRQAQERGFRWALTLDGDGQHSPEDIPAFFQCVEQTS